MTIRSDDASRGLKTSRPNSPRMATSGSRSLSGSQTSDSQPVQIAGRSSREVPKAWRRSDSRAGLETVSRPLSDNELSYFLPSRANGMNDVYLMHVFTAPIHVITPHRLALTLAILFLRHPLLASAIKMGPGDYKSARFEYNISPSPEHGLEHAQSCVSISSTSTDAPFSKSQSRDTNHVPQAYPQHPHDFTPSQVSPPHPSHVPHSIIDDDDDSRPYSEIFDTKHIDLANGPRILSSDKLYAIHLVVGPSAPSQAGEPEKGFFSITSIGSHAILDALTYHRLVNELFCLVGGVVIDTRGQEAEMSDEELFELLSEEWSLRFGDPASGTTKDIVITRSFESKIFGKEMDDRRADSKLREEFGLEQAQNKGGQVFARYPSKATSASAPLSHHILNHTFSRRETTHLVKRCREQGVSLGNVVFAACNLAWARLRLEEESLKESRDAGKGRKDVHANLPLEESTGEEYPALIYTASDLRSSGLAKTDTSSTSTASRVPESYVSLALSYFNVILPPPDRRLLSSQSSSSGSVSKAYLKHEHEALWAQAKMAKEQTARNRSPSASSLTEKERIQLIAEDRAKKAITFAHLDDGVPLPQPPSPPSLPASSNPTVKQAPQAPQVALIGLSLPGDLKKLYSGSPYFTSLHPISPSQSFAVPSSHTRTPQSYPRIELLYMGVTNRKAPPGGNARSKVLIPLMFAHTFMGRLLLHFGWEGDANLDTNDLDEDHTKRGIERYWGLIVEVLKIHIIDWDAVGTGERREAGEVQDTSYRAGRFPTKARTSDFVMSKL